MLKNQDAGKVLSSSVPKSQLTMVDGFGGALPARYTLITSIMSSISIPRSLNGNHIKEKEGGRTIHPPLTTHRKGGF